MFGNNVSVVLLQANLFFIFDLLFHVKLPTTQ